MADFSWITERLVCGGQINSADDMSAIVTAGITHIIDCQIERSDGLLISTSIGYWWAPTADDGKPKLVDWFNRSLYFAIEALSQPGNVVMTHCAAGVNRGPSLAYAILRAQGWTGKAAFDLIHTQRPVTINGIRYHGDAEVALKKLGWTR